MCFSERTWTEKDGVNKSDAGSSLSDTALNMRGKAGFVQHLSSLCQWLVTEGMHTPQAACQFVPHQNVFFSAARESWGQGLA